MLKNSKLIQHQIYFFQSKFGSQFIMPISEIESSEIYVNVLSSVSFKELINLPKYNTIKEYMVEHKIKVGRNYDSVWELPINKYGIKPFYTNYCFRLDFIKSCVIIPIDEVKSDYSELLINLSNSGRLTENDYYPRGFDLISYKRECLIRNILE